MGALRWIKRWGWLLLVAVGAVLVWALRMSSSTPARVLELERRAIDAGEKARLRELEVGRSKANAEIDLEHRAAIRELDTKQRAKGDRLRRNPGARVRWLNRLSAKRRGSGGGRK